MHEMVHILAIVVAQTKELLYISDTSGCGPFTNGCQLGWVRGPSHGQLYGPGNRPRSEEMHISSSSHITGECKGGSGWNGGGVSAPRGYYYTQGYCQGTQLCTDQAHRRRPGSSTFKRLMEHW